MSNLVNQSGFQCKTPMSRDVGVYTEDGGPNGIIVLLAYYYAPAIAAGAQRAERFSKYLPEYGYTVHVVADRVAGAEDTDTITYVPDSENARRRWAPRLIQRLFSAYNDRLYWVFPAVRAVESIMARARVAAVISSSPPLCTHLAALWLKLRYGVTWVADFRDPLAGNVGRVARRNRIVDSIWQRLIFRYTDAAVAVTELVAQRWRTEYPRWASKMSVIWNGFDPAEVFPERQSSPGGRKVIAHVGDCYGDRHPGQLLKSLKRLIARGAFSSDELGVDLIGPLDSDSPVRQMAVFAQLRELGCLHATGEAVPRRIALQAMANADILLILDLHDQKVGYTVPSKLYDYVRVGRPILAFTPRASTVAAILSTCGIPYTCIDPDEPEYSIDTKVSSLLKQSGTTVEASQWFRSTFDGRRQAGVLAKLVSEVRGKK